MGAVNKVQVQRQISIPNHGDPADIPLCGAVQNALGDGGFHNVDSAPGPPITDQRLSFGTLPLWQVNRLANLQPLRDESRIQLGDLAPAFSLSVIALGNAPKRVARLNRIGTRHRGHFGSGIG